MRLLISRVVLMILLLSTFMGLAIVVGRQRSSSHAITILHLNDCTLPCWIGIMPGKTTLAEGRANILSVFGQTNNDLLRESTYNFTVRNRAGNPSFSIYLETFSGADDDPVDSVILSLEQPDMQPSIGELFAITGAPSHVFSWNEFEVQHSLLNNLFYEEAQTLIRIENTGCNPIRLDQKVLTIRFYGPLMISMPDTPNGFIYRWHGFKTCYSSY